MYSTRNLKSADYLGVDLTDRYANTPRPIDVCGLTPVGSNRLRATFWQWEWQSPQRQLDISSIAAELGQAKSTMLDGPQGLAKIGESCRACERESGASGKTPDTLPVPSRRPFAGFLRSSVELFSALHQFGCTISSDNFIGGISEVYPGHIWTRLAKRALPRKSTKEGRLARKLILQELGIEDLPDLPTHDENDACISAVIAAAADGKVTGMTVYGIGLPLIVDDCTLREGPMAIPELTADLERRIEGRLQEMLILTTEPSLPARGHQDVWERAVDLRDKFVKSAKDGEAVICTYARAYKDLFQTPYTRWSQAYAKKVISIAAQIPFHHLQGLGAVRLDTFIVSKQTNLPSDGHWETAGYDREDWERFFANAMLLS